MKVTIKGENELMGSVEEYSGIDYDLVEIEEINKRNGAKVVRVRIKRDKRDILVSSGNFNRISVQDDETGRYLLKYSR